MCSNSIFYKNIPYTWIMVVLLSFSLAVQVNGQQMSLNCVQMFDQDFQQCLRDMGGFEVDIVNSLVTNETSGPLPSKLVPQKHILINTLCGYRHRVSDCIKPLTVNTDPTCQQTDHRMMDRIVKSMIDGLGSLCGVHEAAQGHKTPSICVQTFEQGFRRCLRDIEGFDLDIVFSLITNETSGPLPPKLAPQKQILVSTLCRNRQGVNDCINPLVTNPDSICQQTENKMMNKTVNLMIIGLGKLCSVHVAAQGQQAPTICVQSFENSFRQCFRDKEGFDLDTVFSLVTNETSGPLPPKLAPQKQILVSTLCRNRQGVSDCIKPLVTNPDSICKQTENEMMNKTVNLMIIGLGKLCSVP